MSEHNEQKVKAIFWPGEDHPNVHSNQRSSGQLVFRVFDYGDHYESWIVELRDGKEFVRHNARFLKTIEWEQPQ